METPWPIAQALLAQEIQLIKQRLASIYGYHLVNIGHVAFLPMLSECSMSHRTLLSPTVYSSEFAESVVWDSSAELPLQTNSVDAIVLTHALEQLREPANLITESYRVLIPEGQLLITGINPLSCFGMWHKTTFGTNLHRLSLVKQWLKQVDFEIIQTTLFYFALPHQEESKLLKKVGQYLPWVGAAYCIQARKRIIPLTLIPWRKKRTSWWALPVTVSAAVK